MRTAQEEKTTDSLLQKQPHNFIETFIKKQKKYWRLHVLLLLPMIYIVVFYYGPMYGIQIAFKDFRFDKGILGSSWVGLKYFEQFFSSIMFWRVMKNTLLISACTLAVCYPIPILFAIGLNELRFKKYQKFIQMATYAPYFISTVVMVGIVYQFLDSRIGPLNQIIMILGKEPVNFLSDPIYFIPIFIASSVWQMTGYSSIIYIATLTGVDVEQQEAAVIDGANKLQRIWHIDLPHLMPTAIIMLILSVGSIMNVDFQKIFLMQSPANLSETEVIATYVYKMGITKSQYGLATAVGLFSSVINVLLLLIVNKIAKKTSDISLL